MVLTAVHTDGQDPCWCSLMANRKLQLIFLCYCYHLFLWLSLNTTLLINITSVKSASHHFRKSLLFYCHFKFVHLCLVFFFNLFIPHLFKSQLRLTYHLLPFSSPPLFYDTSIFFHFVPTLFPLISHMFLYLCFSLSSLSQCQLMMLAVLSPSPLVDTKAF